MGQYFSDKVPLGGYVAADKIQDAAAACVRDTENGTVAERTAATRAAITTALETALSDISNHPVKQFWIHGLEKNAKEAAKAEASRLDLQHLLKHVDQFAPKPKPQQAGNKKKQQQIFEAGDDDGPE